MDQRQVLPTSNASSIEPNSPLRNHGNFPSWTSGFREDILASHADIPVCLCSLVSGLCDSVTFNASAVFASMQTGNTIFLALGAAGLPSNVPYMWLRALCSIVAFQLGVFCFAQTRHFRPKSKGTLGASFLLQALIIWIAAALSQGGAVPAFRWLDVAEDLHHQQSMDFSILGPIILLAFQFGGQIVCSRQLGFNEVPTNVLTSVYCDIFSDPNLWASWGANPKRNRRISTVILMLVGGVIGALLSRTGAGMSSALWISGGVKFGIAMAWFGWKSGSSTSKH
ncbi:hypothetical protein S7711_07160 [Stachybotrys chartarum IBT 7711]|uniref:DUF1275 domain protein n=1 Tax=Stachybotrys chartarum (strain CBS 109288 / IBT 7711) TaxID=1280523 RepID=A0A084BAH8_STACB|nr:hypothetical protein S7711_07160 [Stachybotrys chartarum IBT 7711]